jgi:hypothetical protein
MEVLFYVSMTEIANLFAGKGSLFIRIRKIEPVLRPTLTKVFAMWDEIAGVIIGDSCTDSPHFFCLLM